MIKPADAGGLCRTITLMGSFKGSRFAVNIEVFV